MRLNLIIVLVLLMAATSLVPCAAAPRLLICGGTQVLEGDIRDDGGTATFHTDWLWRPENSDGLPKELMRNFITIDDCKTVSNGQELLITSSGGAVALVSHQTGATLFYADVTNAHSGDLLPGGFIAIASSDSIDGTGDRLLLYNRAQSDKVLCELPLKAAHGVVWDTERKLLWVLGDDRLLAVAVDTSEIDHPVISVKNTYMLPSTGGHDLVPATDDSVFYLTTSHQVLTFRPDTALFAPLESFHDQDYVKSITIRPDNGQIAYTQAKNGVWWTYEVHLMNPTSRIVLPSSFYKVRWTSDLGLR